MSAFLRGLFSASVLLLLLTFTGCNIRSSGKPEQKDVYAMDTYMTLKAYGPNAKEAITEAEARIQQLDRMLNASDPDSEVYAVNRDHEGSLTPELSTVLTKAMELYRESNGLFDPAIYPVIRAWGFTDQTYRVPEEEELSELLSESAGSMISLSEDGTFASFSEDTVQIDLGGIAKGYTSDEVLRIFRECQVTSGCISLGGNVAVLGRKPDGSLFRVGIQDPDDASGMLGILRVEDASVITSGAYERNFTENGILYHHIIDPRTGYPAESGVRSATIVSSDGLLADGLSTTLYIMGVADAEAFWRESPYTFDYILMDDSGCLYVTEGIESQFTAADGRQVEIIRK